MIDLTQFTPWTLFTDLGFISILLLVGKFIRVKVKLIQQLFIPPSLIAGLLGLAFGPNGLGWIPLSNDLGTYAAILIALVFGALPLSSPNVSMKEVAKRVGPMWAYAQVGMLLQWALVGLFGLYVIKLIWPDLNDAFGIMLPTGFYGGHGTAAAIGSAFEGLGWDEARSLGMTTATVGVICSIIGGLLMVKWAAKHKQTAFISDFDDLPDELRSGLLPEDKRDSIGEATTSSISIDTLTFHVALVFVVAFLGYMVSQTVKVYYPVLELPVFSCAFIIGLVLKKFFDATTISRYICDNHIQIYLSADDPEAEQFLHGYAGSLRCSVYQARGDRKICLAAYRTHHSGRGDRLVHNILLRKKISQDLLVRAHDFRLGMVDRHDGHGHRLAADRRSETFQQSDG